MRIWIREVGILRFSVFMVMLLKNKEKAFLKSQLQNYIYYKNYII